MIKESNELPDVVIIEDKDGNTFGAVKCGRTIDDLPLYQIPYPIETNGVRIKVAEGDEPTDTKMDTNEAVG